MKRRQNEDEEEEALTEEHNKDVLDIFFEYSRTQNSMGALYENKVVNKFDVDLKFIEEWIQKPIEQIDVIIKATVGIK